MKKIIWLGDFPSHIPELHSYQTHFVFQKDHPGLLQRLGSKTTWAFFVQHWSDEQMKSLYQFLRFKNPHCLVFCESMDSFAEILPLLIEAGVTVCPLADSATWPILLGRWDRDPDSFRSRAQKRETHFGHHFEPLEILDFSTHGLRAEVPLNLEDLEFLSKNIVKIRRQDKDFFMKIRWVQLKMQKMVLGFQIVATQEGN